MKIQRNKSEELEIRILSPVGGGHGRDLDYLDFGDNLLKIKIDQQNGLSLERTFKVKIEKQNQDKVGLPFIIVY